MCLLFGKSGDSRAILGASVDGGEYSRNSHRLPFLELSLQTKRIGCRQGLGWFDFCSDEGWGWTRFGAGGAELNGAASAQWRGCRSSLACRLYVTVVSGGPAATREGREVLMIFWGPEMRR